ncbi:hypothetical protein EV356DRAFT_509496 [Viridothelium virens]|uniref:Uncharacterized protein n=1 Tax=Viridothelium virens TaxID=1048519 RepID=A0A6A6GWH6_VIRVR|nr:hypothetical protein EV356DRAFT_509496 [Viridothelium virens]
MQHRVAQMEHKITETESLLERQIKDLEKTRIEEIEYHMREQKDYNEELETRFIEEVAEPIAEIDSSIEVLQSRIEALQSRLESLEVGISDSYSYIGDRLRANAFNAIALVQNSHLTLREQKLSPLRAPATNTPIPGFPEKVGDIVNLNDAQLTSLLFTLEEDVGISQELKLDRFRAAIGIAQSVP